MIFATIQSSSPDGEVVLVHPNRELAARFPEANRKSLLQALEDWDSFISSANRLYQFFIKDVYDNVIQLSESTLLAPLPRTWALLDGSAFIQHVILVRKARGAEPPDDLYTIPLMYQGASDNLFPPEAMIPLSDESYGMDFEAEFAIITDNVPLGTKAQEAGKHIKLVMLMNDVSLRNLIPRELATGFGFFHGKPQSSFSPLVLTLDELGGDWKDGRVQLGIRSTLNGKIMGEPLASEMHFSFYDLIEHAAKTRPLSAGTIIGSGTVSNKDESKGVSCLAEIRMLETIKDGKPATPFMKWGDVIEIEAVKDNISLFGKINNKITK